jgi:hypothetical protein
MATISQTARQAKYCHLCSRPMASTWVEFAARDAAASEALEKPLETDRVGDCRGCLREIEEGVPDQRSASSCGAVQYSDTIGELQRNAEDRPPCQSVSWRRRAMNTRGNVTAPETRASAGSNGRTWRVLTGPNGDSWEALCRRIHTHIAGAWCDGAC